MKKFIKGIFKATRLIAIVYGIVTILTHLWISVSRILRQIRLYPEHMDDDSSMMERIMIYDGAVIEEAAEEWSLFKEQFTNK